MAGENTHADLLRFFPGATSARCEGDGWAAVTREDGHQASARCPGCERDRLMAAVAACKPARFRADIELPGAVREWAGKGRRAGTLYLAGQVGTGKTHAAWMALGEWCVASRTFPELREREGMYGTRVSPNVVVTRVTDLLDDLRPGDHARERVRDCQNAALLVLDDLGAEKASEWTQERLYSIVDHRYVHDLPMIVTGNLPPGQPVEAQVGPRTASRLAEMAAVVTMLGADRRKAGARA